ncbi:27903_t:CDS:2 [Dentiscutata erythropus]|uniref:27903_t:CDS:1 n=1 Tax=Dentiscutata erythropus TaxID=1348616 RepID=A0A9N9C9U4_9GLOM|nr:27903_t:CDS:2 [Dentiscutata erythropus]
MCCKSGKIKLASGDAPALRNLFIRNDNIGKDFRENIRAYNSIFAFTSMGIKFDEDLANGKDGVYTFRVQGEIYHSIGSLLQVDGIPRFLQMYIYDTEFETMNRLSKMPKLRPETLEYIKALMDQLNPFITNFRSISLNNNISNLYLLIRADHKLDQRVYNRPTASQVAAIWVEGLQDSLQAGLSNASDVGRHVVLPSSFMGGPCDMYQRYQDAMALVQTYGKPDIFITITCNPRWPEIIKELMPLQTLQDRPDLADKIHNLVIFV